MIPIISYKDRQEKLSSVLSRSASFDPDVAENVAAILEKVRSDGDAALQHFTKLFDGVDPKVLRVPEAALDSALSDMEDDLKEVVTAAAVNIRTFHEHQVQKSWFVDEPDGVILGQRLVPMDRVGLYVPGGKAFYPSTLLMNAIPALVAGVEQIAVTSPPREDGLPSRFVLGVARMLGLSEVYSVGGAQAIGALAYGTESIMPVDKVVGPGNAYVAAAKKMVFGRVAIDSVAGPSEIAILADDTGDPEFIALDLLSQAEHDETASAILVTPSRKLAGRVREEVDRMVPGLPRKAILARSLADYSACVVTQNMDQATHFINELAPEHLEIITIDPWRHLSQIRHAGAIFLGSYSAESVGDYIAGPNHVLPTGGTARYASALGVDDFVRKQSIISYTPERLLKTGGHIARFAGYEQLHAHAEAVNARLRRIEASDSGLTHETENNHSGTL